jgi:hypothetical protein
MSKKMIAGIAVAFLFVSLVACHKFVDIDDLWHKHNPDCRIEEIVYVSPSAPDTLQAKFSYNHKGNPTSVLFNDVGTGRPNFVFRYNHKGQLTDFIGPYTNNHYEIWFHYELDAKGRAISDSFYVFGSYIAGQPLPDATIRSGAVYEYDDYDRVKKVTRTYAGGTPFTETDEYLYNMAGNLDIHNTYFNGIFTGTETFTYDNKVHLRRTNRIWMFIDRDYSKNNSRTATQYNSSGLPTKYDLAFPDLTFLFNIHIVRGDITYRCK